MGATVYYTAINDALHVSGHETSEEIKLMINLARPKYLIPIGATYRGMRAFANLAKDLGYPENQVLLLEDGRVVEVSSGKAEINGRVEAKNIYVDGLGVGDIGAVVLRDRKVLAEEGVVLVVVPIDGQTSKVAGEPDIISRGFVFEKGSEELLDRAKRVVEQALAHHPEGVLDWRFIRRHIEESLAEFFYKETQRRPMVLPVVVEV